MANSALKALPLSLLLVLTSFLYVIEVPSAKAYGNETIQVDIDGSSTYFEYLEGVTFTITLGDLDTNVNYDLEWRICSEQWSSDGDWVDGDCSLVETYVEYTDSSSNMHSNSRNSRRSHYCTNWCRNIHLANQYTNNLGPRNY